MTNSPANSCISFCIVKLLITTVLFSIVYNYEFYSNIQSKNK